MKPQMRCRLEAGTYRYPVFSASTHHYFLRSGFLLAWLADFRRNDYDCPGGHNQRQLQGRLQLLKIGCARWEVML